MRKKESKENKTPMSGAVSPLTCRYPSTDAGLHDQSVIDQFSHAAFRHHQPVPGLALADRPAPAQKHKATPQKSPSSRKKTTHILSISYDRSLLRTRAWILEAEGYNVTSALGFDDALEQCQNHNPDFVLVIMGHSIPHKDKTRFVAALKQHCDAPVLSLIRTGDRPFLQAEYWLEASEGPESLIRKVREAISGPPPAKPQGT